MDDGIATIIAAGIAAVISFVSSGVALHAANKSNKSAEQSNEVTNRTNREIAMAEQDAENKRNDIQIDANIVWTARVEWIQNVRNLTAEFISAVNNYILSDNIELRKRNFEIVWEKSRLLILYFGPDADGLVDDNSNILDKHSNKAIIPTGNPIIGIIHANTPTIPSTSAATPNPGLRALLISGTA